MRSLVRGASWAAAPALFLVLVLASACNGQRVVGCESADCAGNGGTGGNGDGGNGGTMGGTAGADGCDPSCGGTTPVCDGATAECVACLDADDCDDGLCDPEAHACVECLEQGDCTEASAARCDAGECVGCAEHADCEGIPGKGLCLPATGECVECIPGEHDTCGEGQLCHGELRSCVEAQSGSAPTCKPCVADAHCEVGFRCVQPNLRGEEGFFCLPEPNPGCVTRRPFVQDLEDVTTIDGETVTVCGHRFTSCAGFGHFSTAVEGCSEALDPPPGDGDGACGLPGTGDNTRCRTFSTEARCTYQCSSKDDCLCGHDCVSQVCALTTSAGGECD